MTDADGSIDILIQTIHPVAIKNRIAFLPQKEQFKMVLRGYRPKAELIDHRFRIPGVERVD
jgi:hypothetical protein